jgi:hypothetical protein
MNRSTLLDQIKERLAIKPLKFVQIHILRPAILDRINRIYRINPVEFR